MTDNIRIACLLAFIFAAPLSVKSQEKPLYSDFTGIKGEATGHIYVEEIDGKHWFIDPNGYAFFPVGLDHTRFFGNTVDLVSNGDEHACANHAFDMLSDMGVNCCAALGGMAQKKSALERGFSYAQGTGLTPHSSTYKNENYHRDDPFSKEFDMHVERVMKRSARGAEQDPHVLGLSYGWNPFQLMHKWINHFMASSENTPAKVAIVDEVYIKQYGNISEFNQVYGTTFKSFNEIKSDTSIRYNESYDPKPDEVVGEDDFKKRDFNKITCLLITQVHKVAFKYARQYAPNKLILGYFFKPYNFNLDMYAAIAPYVDVLSPQHLHILSYKKGEYNKARGVLPTERIYELTGKPIFISDMAMGKVYKKNNKPTENNVYGPYNTHEDRGKVYYAAVEKAAALPSVVGLTACMTIYDNPDENGQHGGNKGFIDPYTKKEKTEFTSYVRDINSKIYEIRLKENDIDQLTQDLIDAMHKAIH